MKIEHRPHHWIIAAIVLAILAFAVSEVRGQASGSATFEGRPAMAGAQAGTGAMAGPPQGGIGVQGTEGSLRALRRAPAASQPATVTGDMPRGTPAVAAPVAESDAADKAVREDAKALRNRGNPPAQRK